MAFRDSIPIDPDELPVQFPFDFDDTEYTLSIQYNEFSDQITVAIFDDDGLIAVEPLVLNQPLFQALSNPRLPMITLVPMDESGQEIEVNIDNLNKTVFVFENDVSEDDVDDSGDDDGDEE